MWGFLKRDKKDKAASEPPSQQPTLAESPERDDSSIDGDALPEVVERAADSNAQHSPAPLAQDGGTAVAVGAETVAVAEEAVEQEKPAKGGWLSRLKSGLTATRERLGSQIGTLLGRHTRID